MAQKKITDLTLRADFDGTCNLPVDDAIQTYRVTGAQMLAYMKGVTSRSDEIMNLALASSVGSNILTLAVKTKANGNASASDPITVSMRSSTLTSGLFVNRSLTSSLSMTVSSGSTLGQVSGQPSVIYVYLIDNAGTLELAVSHSYFPENELVSTTAEGGAGAADSATVMYSTSARSSVACRLIGYILNTQATAGTWASAGTQVQLEPANSRKFNTVTRILSGTSTYNTPAGCKSILVRMVGGGGEGGGSGTSGGGTPTAGTATTFGTSLLTAAGGGVGAWGLGGAGGAVTINSPAIDIASAVGQSGDGAYYHGNGTYGAGGGHGGNARYFQGGGASIYQNDGAAATTNSGGGGAGAGAHSTNLALGGGGGGSGGYVEARINNPLASYDYAIGAAGAGGTGTGAVVHTGGAGATGCIIIEESY